MTVQPRPDTGRVQGALVQETETGIELTVRGVVQGVGFRPFVHRLAKKLGYSGSVTNCEDGVVIKLAPPHLLFDQFLKSLSEEAPPLAKITSLEQKKGEGFFGQKDFSILASKSAGTANTMIPPDVAVCDDCLSELFNRDDPRFSYPFLNCTNCGPRFSIVESIPYDRPKTSMKVFPMCLRCEDEYGDLADRRFHAQPNACWKCGPKLSWHDNNGMRIQCDNPLEKAVQSLMHGHVVAMRGLGGFHLAVDGTSEQAIQKLRRRKNRPSKPLAVMVADINSARDICTLSSEEANTLSSYQRPIVLLPTKKNAPLAPSLAPGVFHLGVMLPYTPFHHLLFRAHQAPKILVMTSGNKSDEPICTSNEDALTQLSDIADFFLLHNRDIVTRVDDSVVRIIAEKARPMRRSRGYVPESVTMDVELPEIIACGAQLKNTFCLARGRDAFLSQHIGDLDTVETLEFYEESIDHLQQVLEIHPQAVACDMHPDYLSTRYAEKLNLPLYRVQHHHAHAVAVMAENNLKEDTLAVILDGTGYGPDGTVWGGEILLSGLTSFQRVAHLEETMLPGGDTAAREPWRMAFAALSQAYGSVSIENLDLVPSLQSVPEQKREMIAQMMATGMNTPFTSSCGRLFDSVAALLGLRTLSDYEGQAAMELEALALQYAEEGSLESRMDSAQRFPVVLEKNQDKLLIKKNPMIRAIMDSMAQGVDRSSIAFGFHSWLIDSITAAISELAVSLDIGSNLDGSSGKHQKKKNIVLGGGCLQNEILLTGLSQKLIKSGFQVHSAEKVPTNDGGISLGQAVVGGLQHLHS